MFWTIKRSRKREFQPGTADLRGNWLSTMAANMSTHPALSRRLSPCPRSSQPKRAENTDSRHSTREQIVGSQSRWGRLKTGSGNDILEDVRITCLGGAEELPEPEETLENDLAGRTSVKKEETANTAAKPVPETPPAQEDETLPAATPSQLAKPEEKATSSQLARRDNPES